MPRSSCESSGESDLGRGRCVISTLLTFRGAKRGPRLSRFLKTFPLFRPIDAILAVQPQTAKCQAGIAELQSRSQRAM